MDNFLSTTEMRSSSVPRVKGRAAGDSPTKMATTTDPTSGGQQVPAKLLVSSKEAEEKSNAAQVPDCTKIAEAVALLLHPTIVAALEQALQQGMAEIKKDLQMQTQQLAEAEQRISKLEHELMQAHNKWDILDHSPQQGHG